MYSAISTGAASSVSKDMDKLQAEIKHSTHIAGLSNDQDKIQLAKEREILWKEHNCSVWGARYQYSLDNVFIFFY